MLPVSYGYWLDPATGESYSVITHQGWLLDHAAKIGLADELFGLDPRKDEDAIRVIGCKAGLVRIRDYGVRMSVQFWVDEPGQLPTVLRAIRDFLPTIGAGPLKSIWLNNLATGDQVTVPSSEFIALVDAGGDLFSGER